MSVRANWSITCPLLLNTLPETSKSSNVFLLSPNSFNLSNSPLATASITASTACIISLEVAPAISDVMLSHFLADNPILSNLAVASITCPVSKGVLLANAIASLIN